jgi:hypothetical protein
MQPLQRHFRLKGMMFCNNYYRYLGIWYFRISGKKITIRKDGAYRNNPYCFLGSKFIEGVAMSGQTMVMKGIMAAFRINVLTYTT